MEIDKLDPRLAVCEIREEDVLWRSALAAPFSLHGVFFDEEEKLYRRMPLATATAVSGAVRTLSRMTAGGRLRFRTDSPYIALRCLAPAVAPMPHMPLTGSHGFTFYLDGAFDGKVTPPYAAVAAPLDGRFSFGGSCRHHAGEGMHDVEIAFPLYACVAVLEVGLAEGAVVEPPRPYTYEKPIVCYGSSITQGACASRAGNDAVGLLSRMLDSEILNLGFSGNGNAEPPMLSYLASLDAGAYIFDYNFYHDVPDRVLPPHLEIYETLRSAHPDVPILMIDKPGCDYDRMGYLTRSAMIEETYRTARSRGDDLVGYLDAHALFGEEGRDCCLVDANHPNDLGFYRMATALRTALEPLLLRARDRR